MTLLDDGRGTQRYRGAGLAAVCQSRGDERGIYGGEGGVDLRVTALF